MDTTTNALDARAPIGRPWREDRFAGAWRPGRPLAALAARLRGAAAGSERFAPEAAGATDRELARLNRSDQLVEIERAMARHQIGLRRPL